MTWLAHGQGNFLKPHVVETVKPPSFHEQPPFAFRAHWDHEPGRDAFHRVPIFGAKVTDAVERVPTNWGARFMQSLPQWIRRHFVRRLALWQNGLGSLV